MINKFHKKNDSVNDETAAELTGNIHHVYQKEEKSERQMFGWIAVILSFLSFFWLPLLLGIAGIIVGKVARNKKANVLGTVAIILGASSIVFSLLIGPLI